MERTLDCELFGVNLKERRKWREVLVFKGDPGLVCVSNCERFLERFCGHNFTQENE